MLYSLKSFFFRKTTVQPLVALVILFLGFTTAYAINSVSEGYRVTGSTRIVNAQGTCYSAKTTSGNDVFFPTKTATEWNAFLAHRPSNVSLGECCLGVKYGGYCFHVGSEAPWSSNSYGETCGQICASYGGYNDAGSDWAASNMAQCSTVVSLLEPGARDVQDYNRSGTGGWVGCFVTYRGDYINKTGYYVAIASYASDENGTMQGGIKRVCACNY